jgi:hypothetical protein
MAINLPLLMFKLMVEVFMRLDWLMMWIELYFNVNLKHLFFKWNIGCKIQY